MSRYANYVVNQVWLVVETAIVWFLYPETKGPTLEELAYRKSGPDVYNLCNSLALLLIIIQTVFEEKPKHLDDQEYADNTKPEVKEIA